MSLLHRLRQDVESAQKYVAMYERIVATSNGHAQGVAAVSLRKAQRDLSSAQSKLRNYTEHGSMWPQEEAA